ncbi:MAG: Hint domain-containing protein [Janthinobacterium lividum]
MQFNHDPSLADHDAAMPQDAGRPGAHPKDPQEGHAPSLASPGDHPHGLMALPEVLCAPAAACFVAGTLISTLRGLVAVEALCTDDTLWLADGGTAPVIWIGHRRVRAADPVRVVADAFGPGLPRRDLVLSPEHALFVGGHLVPVHVLVDGVSVVQEERDRVTYHHVELDRHAILFAEGLPAESYLDTGNRSAFANAAVVEFAANFGPGAVVANACAPLALDGPVVDAVRADLRRIAGERALRAA